MDKFRTAAGGKRPKTKGHVTPFDLIPLGQKAGEASKSKLLAAAKTEPSTSAGSSLLAKRPKYAATGADKSLIKYDDMAIDCHPTDLYDKIQAEGEDSDMTDRLLCGAIKHMRCHRAKPSQQIILTLMTLAKDKPLLFTTDVVTGALCTLLKRDLSVNFKAKGNPTVTVLACNLLYAAYVDESHWPQQFVEVYLDDSLGERVWVDRSDCKAFNDNIITSFGTKLTPKNPTLLENLSYIVPGASAVGGSSSSPSHSPFHLPSFSGDVGDESSSGSGLGLSKPLVKSRYKFQLDSIEQLVMDTITEQMTKRQHIEVASKQLLRLLTSTAGYCAVRLLVVTKLEIWLQNPKLMRAAQDLLLSSCLNCTGQNPHDKDVIVGLLKIRVKNKQIVSHYLACIRELLEAEEENLRISMAHTIYNEMSQARNQNNMQILSIMFQQDSNRTPKMLADIFLDMLMGKEDYLRSLRALLREIVRTLRHDFTFDTFCLGLMGDHSNHPVFARLDDTVKERVLYAIADLVVVCELLTISPAVKEASAPSISWGDKRKDIAVTQMFWTQIAKIQRHAVTWLHDSFLVMVPTVESQAFIQCLYKLLMMAHGDHYSKVDNWPAEADRALMLRVVSETPVLEDTLIRILMMGMDAEYSLKASDALDVMELMINRAAALSATNYPVLEVKNLDMVRLLLAVSTYHHPDNIALPSGYNPPHLAISPMYWKSWLMMLIMAAYNPASFASHIWKEYPTLEMMMEMVMTNVYTFPPVSCGDEFDRTQAQERQICELEKQEILEFEGHLAAATSSVTITETNSLLLSQLISMNAKGPARRMPPKIVDDLKRLNSSFHLGHLLSKSRKPDFLLQVIQKQGTSKAMPWLAELVESSEGSLDVLPIQCLCEFLLMSSEDAKSDDLKTKQSQKIARYDRLLQRLQTIIHQATDSDGEAAATEVIKYFFERLYSSSPATRALAIKALRAMFVDPVTQQAMDIDIDMQFDQYEWLLVSIPEINIFSLVEKLIQESIQKALCVEMDEEAVAAYITYLLESKIYRREPSETMLELSQMLCSRPFLCKQLLINKETYKVLLVAYKHFMEDAISRTSAFEWEDESNTVMVQWPDDQVVVLHLHIIHAMVGLLSDNHLLDYDAGRWLLDTWFPASGDLPVGCQPADSDLVDLLTDRLRRQMLQTGQMQLVTAALSDVKLKQLLLLFQSFGLPANSVDAILQLLDELCQTTPKFVKKAVHSQKQYLSQLMAAQRLRGVTGGHLFATLLQEKERAQPMDVAASQLARLRKLAPAVRTLSTLESRKAQTMGSDVEKFVRGKLCSRATCKEGLMVAQMSIAADPAKKELLSAALVKVLLAKDKSSALTALNSVGHLTAALLRLLATDVKNLPQATKRLFELLHNEAGLSALIQTTVKSVFVKLSPPVTPTADLEATFNQQMVKLCLSNQISKAVEICLQQAERIQSGKDNRTSLGLIVDWLELLDPEIDSLCTSLQDKLLFGKCEAGDGVQSKASLAGPAYLRSLLTHQTRWSTIRRTIHRLLAADNIKQWTPTAVLDFLVVCISHPRLYQGREQKKPKNAAMENVLRLVDYQTHSVANLICLEVMQTLPSSGAVELEPSRVKLLLNCCVEESVLKSLVQHLEERSASSTPDSVCYKRLLTMLYAQQPKLIHWIGDCSIFYQDLTLALTGPCTLDPEIHSALSTLGNVKAGKKYVNISRDANLVCRKLASHHPLLFLRHVSMLSSILSGKVQLSYGEFIHRNYLLLHTNVLGLVELLQPHVYLHQDFPAIIEAYFTVIKLHGKENDDTIAALFIKFIAILCNFFHSLPDMCVRAISQYKEMLSVLTNDPKYNKNPNLKSLATASYMPHTKESSTDTDLLAGLLLPSPPQNLTFTNEQLKTTLRKLSRDSSTEDTLNALADLDATSKKVIDVLGRCLDEFKHLILSQNLKVRDSTFKLIKRYTRHNPRVAADFLTPVVACLRHDNADISRTALSYVADLAILMIEADRNVLIDAAFTVAALHNSEEGMKGIRDIVRLVSTNVYGQLQA